MANYSGLDCIPYSLTEFLKQSGYMDSIYLYFCLSERITKIKCNNLFNYFYKNILNQSVISKRSRLVISTLLFQKYNIKTFLQNGIFSSLQEMI